jgi:hypothetical protein
MTNFPITSTNPTPRPHRAPGVILAERRDAERPAGALAREVDRRRVRDRRYQRVIDGWLAGWVRAVAQRQRRLVGPQQRHA